MNQTKLLFIDSKVENYHHLISQVDPQTKTVILQPNQNGIDQISQSLGECRNVDTVHIISHGAKGALYLGNNILSLDNIHLYVESIQQWGKYLSANGEILIYGCQVASGKEGREFIRQLHQLTGANIAASETLTGNVSRGGNWNLEVIFGQLKSALAFTPEVRASYAGVLANIVVNTTDDVVNDSDGVTSLREAIIEANSTPEDDTIQLTSGETYNLTISGRDEDAAATGDLDIVAGGGEITIISEGGEQAVIDAGGEIFFDISSFSPGTDRVFHVLEDGILQLENLEITGGSVNNSNGGGIYNSGTLTINNSTISGNIEEFDILFESQGGGIYNRGGTTNISNSTISGNLADGGAGISNVSFGIVNINNSTISNNSTYNYSNDGRGGGISNFFGTINISNSTISSNNASRSGGGIFSFFGTNNISSSTISGNSADSSGGMVSSENFTIDPAAFNLSNSTNISNSTISGNSADSRGGLSLSGTSNITNSTISNNSASDGFGGIYNVGTANISNSTISGNSASDAGGIYNLGTAIISNSTITGNEAASGLGSGILHQTTRYQQDVLDYYGNYISLTFYGNTTITSSIISGNVNSDVDFTESSSALISGDNNIIGTGNAINNFNGDNDQTGIADPLLGDLGDNGGLTLTHLLLPNSPAIDAGSNPNELTTDQRGEQRLVGDGVDIGAVELQNSTNITGTPEIDRLTGTNENNTIIGLAGNDTIDGRGGDDQIIGSRGSDSLYGKDGNDTLQGRQDNDRLFGGNGNDSLVGGQGRDRFNGGAGNDTLAGGASIDRFIFNTNQEFTLEDVGVDTIADFVPQQDIILLDKNTFTAIASDSGTGFSVDAEFAIVMSDAEAEISPAVIVYNSNNGRLFYNVNGTEVEFGSGGEFANLTNNPSISENDFFLRE